MTNTTEAIENVAPETTDIFADSERLLAAIEAGAVPIEIMPCKVNGEDSAAICVVDFKVIAGQPGLALTPVFVAVTDGMKLLNEAGEEPKTTGDYAAEAEPSKDAPTTDDSASEDQRQAA